MANSPKSSDDLTKNEKYQNRKKELYDKLGWSDKIKKEKIIFEDKIKK
jgi:hypothetical protein